MSDGSGCRVLNGNEGGSVRMFTGSTSESDMTGGSSIVSG